MKKLQLFSTLVICSVFIVQSHAQYFDMGVQGGIMKYNGDLTPTTGDLEIHPALGGFLRYHFNPRWALSTSFIFGSISGKDSNAEDPVRQRRNLSFKSSLSELAFRGEFNILPFTPQLEKDKRALAPYLFAGLGFTFFKPKAYYNGTWYELQPLGTEGQGTERYQYLQLSFPMGLGFRYGFSAKGNIGFEVGYRFTTTDYLDDVSGNYADPATVAALHGPIAAALSNRTAEVTGTPADNLTGTPRGSNNRNDGYLVFTLYFSGNFFNTFPFHERKSDKAKIDTKKWF